MNQVLKALKDIPGVFGSFVLTPDGALASRDMPEVYADSIFSEIGRRLNGISEAAEPHIDAVNELVVKFESHWLISRRRPGFTFNVLAEQSVNYPALKMALNVAIRQIGDVTVTAAPTASAVTAVPVAASSPTAPEAPKRRWRGHVLD